jgi:hypothetical protein
MTERGPRFGVIVPCRNEAAVVERRLRNLALLRWPAAPGPHRVLVVDDGSDDQTAARARAEIARLGAVEGLEFEVLVNNGARGKASAIALAVAHLEGADLLLLTDADVVFREPSPLALASAFDDPRLGMACGAQEFVEDLTEDGRCLGADGAEPRPAPDAYDRLTAVVRGIESRGGRLFSVHGQCLCWRAGLGIRPTPGFAADDLDLMLQVRARGLGVGLVDGARFLEPKVADSQQRDQQALRRAEAYFQLVRRTPFPLRCGAVDRLQWAAYRFLPGLAPWAPVLGLAAAPPAVGWVFSGASGAGLGPALQGAMIGLFVGLTLATRRLAGWILRASARERRRGLDDSWETARA